MVSLKKMVGVFGFAVMLIHPVGAKAESLCEGVVIRQELPPRVSPGQTLEFAITLHHSGKCRIEGLEVVDYLPQSLSWMESRPEPDRLVAEESVGDSPTPVKQARWTQLRLEPEGSLTFRLRLKAGSETASGWIRNTVCFSAPSIVRKCSDIETFIRSD